MALTENQKIWLDALRSGEYKQGPNGVLHEKNDGVDEFCCLGVAAKIFAGEYTSVEFSPIMGDTVRFRYDNHTAMAPDYVMEALDLVDDLGEHKHIHDDSLAALNDRGVTFAEIADIFEANLGAYTKS